MRKNKRRKKRLKTALILLIILFILAGFGGMLFVSHKNKIEKEQRKEAALAALDSIPEITATPGSNSHAGPHSYADTVADTGTNHSSGF